MTDASTPRLAETGADLPNGHRSAPPGQTFAFQSGDTILLQAVDEMLAFHEIAQHGINEVLLLPLMDGLFCLVSVQEKLPVITSWRRKSMLSLLNLEYCRRAGMAGFSRAGVTV